MITISSINIITMITISITIAGVLAAPRRLGGTGVGWGGSADAEPRSAGSISICIVIVINHSSISICMISTSLTHVFFLRRPGRGAGSRVGQGGSKTKGAFYSTKTQRESSSF